MFRVYVQFRYKQLMYILKRWLLKATALAAIATFVSGCLTVCWTVMLIPLCLVGVIFLPFYLVMLPIYYANEGAPDTFGVQQIAVAPDGRSIAGTVLENGKTRLVRFPVEGESTPILLTDGNHSDFDPVYTPSGDSLLFARNTGRDESNLFAMEPDGSNLRQLTHTKGNLWGVNLSKDGQWAVFSYSEKGKQADIHLLNLVTLERLTVTNDEDSHDINPILLEDGETILFARGTWFGHYSPIAASAWHDFDLFTVQKDGTDLRQLTRQSSYGTSRMERTSDRNRVLYSYGGFVSLEDGQIADILPKGIRYTVLSETDLPVNDPGRFRISRDGKRLAFLMSEETSEGKDIDTLHIMDVEDQTPREIARHESIHSVSWMPSGDAVAFTSSRSITKTQQRLELWLAMVDGSPPRRLDYALESGSEEKEHRDEDE
ncbi:MAG: hypothetical protein AMXMBFR84_22440 [Candidatus Hydrogenedentota bacterium]